LAEPLRILVVEDLPEQAEIVTHELNRAGFLLAWSIASDLTGCRTAIGAGVDLVVADCDTVAVDFPALMALVGERSDPPPVVALSLDDGDGVARECLRRGASAFLHKLRLDQIGDLVRGLMQPRTRLRAAAIGSGLVDLRAFAEDASDLVAELSCDGRLLYVNPSVRAKLGYAAEELTGRRAFEFLHPEELPKALELLRKMTETGCASRRAHRVRRCDGSWCWLESTANPCCTAGGERRVVAIAREITAAVRALPREVDLGASVPPAIPSGNEAAAAPSRDAPQEAGLQTVLVVESQDSLRFVICGALEEDGYRVIQAASADEALQRAAHHSGPIHLLLSDLAVQGSDGRELAKRVGGSRRRPRTILFSDSAGDPVELARKWGCAVGLLRKPFTLAALRAKLHQVLEEAPHPLESG
jgi:PAS domain S-box-containing protein